MRKIGMLQPTSDAGQAVFLEKRIEFTQRLKRWHAAQEAGGKEDWISDTRFPTNTFHLDGWPRNHESTTAESVQQNMGASSRRMFGITKPKSLTISHAVHSSRRGMLWSFRGATFVLE